MPPPDDREQWRTRNELTFALVSLALGPSNVVAFPYLIYDNGGVVFVLVYTFLVATVGLSMLYLETFLGQFSGWSVPKAFGGFPMAKGLGWTMVYTTVLLSVFQSPYMAYCLIYMVECFSPHLPWESCPGGGGGGAGAAAAVSGVADNHSSLPALSGSSSNASSSSDGCYEIGHGLVSGLRTYRVFQAPRETSVVDNWL
ncbi:sodium- and chloride-dependent neutral and basic amino acid transporter B(0+)-like [Dermacentor andersoni]|uniref:sodium- and chloride-dependent neutral and basic amino acid transporter B(0+)-like n=1 Tax=Dermacentor andersoni TaxID=34620 RepID=UPI002415F368|nr:sodium- and chloride-dependent neutral and basic amino acid transporter B(0+)-like [Dermacentor andersoni]